MKPIRPVLFVALASPLLAAPTDGELLRYVKERATLERVTPERVEMAAAVSERCNIDALPVVNPHAATFHVYANDRAVLPVFDP